MHKRGKDTKTEGSQVTIRREKNDKKLTKVDSIISFVPMLVMISR